MREVLPPEYSLVGNDVYTDVEMFEPYASEHNDSTILKQLEKYAPNNACVLTLADLLRKPIYSCEELHTRQERIRAIQTIYSTHTKKTDELIGTIRESESDVQWLLSNEHKDDILNTSEFVYVNWKALKHIGCNSSALFLYVKNIYTIMVSPILSIFSPVISIIIPFIILRFKFNLKIPFTTFMRAVVNIIMTNMVWILNSRRTNFIQILTYCISMMVYIQALLNTLELSKNTYKVVRFVTAKIDSLVNYVNACEELMHVYRLREEGLSLGWKLNRMRTGDKLVLYKQIYMPETTDDIRKLDALNTYLRNVNRQLAFISVARLTQVRGMCFAEFVDDTPHPVVSAKQMYHISIANPVTNDYCMRGENCVITGPNAAGKSTIIKALLINTIFSQTFGVACAEEFVISPFYFINSQINIPDVKGKMSLFEAEMYRCKYNIDIVKGVPPNRKCLIVMDEMFNTTNVVEGVSGAYGILYHLCKSKNVCTVITTHYSILAKTRGFKACRMEVEHKDDGTIGFPYKLSEGISKQFVAIELLKNHFDQDVIDSSINFKKKILLV